MAAEGIFERGKANLRGPLNRQGPLWEPRCPYLNEGHWGPFGWKRLPKGLLIIPKRNMSYRGPLSAWPSPLSTWGGLSEKGPLRLLKGSSELPVGPSKLRKGSLRLIGPLSIWNGPQSDRRGVMLFLAFSTHFFPVALSRFLGGRMIYLPPSSVAGGSCSCPPHPSSAALALF